MYLLSEICLYYEVENEANIHDYVRQNVVHFLQIIIKKTKEVEDFDFLAHGFSFYQKVKHYMKEQVKFIRISQI